MTNQLAPGRPIILNFEDIRLRRLTKDEIQILKSIKYSGKIVDIISSNIKMSNYIYRVSFPRILFKFISSYVHFSNLDINEDSFEFDCNSDIIKYFTDFYWIKKSINV